MLEGSEKFPSIQKKGKLPGRREELRQGPFEGFERYEEEEKKSEISTTPSGTGKKKNLWATNTQKKGKWPLHHPPEKQISLSTQQRRGSGVGVEVISLF